MSAWDKDVRAFTSELIRSASHMTLGASANGECGTIIRNAVWLANAIDQERQKRHEAMLLMDVEEEIEKGK